MKQTIISFIVLCGVLVLSGAHPQGGHGHSSIRQRFLDSGICAAYNAATQDDRDTCSDEFVNGLAPANDQGRGRGRRQLSNIVNRICLDGGVVAENACQILDEACSSDAEGSTTLERCRGRRHRRDSSSSSESSSEEEAGTGAGADGGSGTAAATAAATTAAAAGSTAAPATP